MCVCVCMYVILFLRLNYVFGLLTLDKVILNFLTLKSVFLIIVNWIKVCFWTLKFAQFMFLSLNFEMKIN